MEGDRRPSAWSSRSRRSSRSWISRLSVFVQAGDPLTQERSRPAPVRGALSGRLRRQQQDDERQARSHDRAILARAGRRGSGPAAHYARWISPSRPER